MEFPRRNAKGGGNGGICGRAEASKCTKVATCCCCCVVVIIMCWNPLRVSTTQILESMPVTNEVEELLQVLGPFYEIVDDKKKISQVSDLTTGTGAEHVPLLGAIPQSRISQLSR